MIAAIVPRAGAMDPETHRDVGPVEDFELDRFRFIEIEGRPVGVVRTVAGLFAVRNVCPHQGAEICKGRITGAMLTSRPGEFRLGLEGRVLICPWHRWEFDLGTGETVYHFSDRRLVTYDVQVVEGRVWVSESWDRDGRE